MTAETIFTNARILAPDRVIDGTLLVRGDRIAAIDDAASRVAGAVDLDGDYLLPGLVELHTDNLEKHFSPRPGVRWPGMAAVIDHDARIAAAGITTVFDAVALAAIEVLDHGQRLANLDAMVQMTTAAVARGLLRADHRLHLRCEVSNPACPDYFRNLADNPLVGLVSVMDHTPGQRQFASLDTYRRYYQKTFGLDDAQFDEFQQRTVRQHEQYSAGNRRTIVALARERGFQLASHDDATPAHIAEAVADGVSIAEFPTTGEAAAAARAGGLKVLMGAPNVVLGGSQSGNVSALSLAQAGFLDILSSDYVPGALIAAAFQLAAAGIALPAAIATVTLNSAQAVGLDDRGALAAGLRADLVRARDIDGMPVVRGVWRGGERII